MVYYRRLVAPVVVLAGADSVAVAVALADLVLVVVAHSDFAVWVVALVLAAVVARLMVGFVVLVLEVSLAIALEHRYCPMHPNFSFSFSS